MKNLYLYFMYALISFINMIKFAISFRKRSQIDYLNDLLVRPHYKIIKFLILKRIFKSLFDIKVLSDTDYLENLKCVSMALPSVKLSETQKLSLIALVKDNGLSFGFKGLDQEFCFLEAIFSSLSIRLDKFGISKDFYYNFLQNKLSLYHNYRLVLTRLKNLGFDFSTHHGIAKKLSNARFLDSFMPEEMCNEFKIPLNAWIQYFGDKETLINECYWISKQEYLDSWINVILDSQHDKNYVIGAEAEYILFLKLLGRTYNQRLKDKISYYLPPDCLLISLINQNYDFTFLSGSHVVNLMIKHKTMKDFVEDLLGKSNRKLVRKVSEALFHGKFIDFPVAYLLMFIKDYDVNHIYEIIDQRNKNSVIPFHLDTSEEMIVKKILNNFSIRKQINLIIEMYSEVSLVREMATQYRAILKVSPDYRILQNFKSVKHLSDFVKEEYKKNPQINIDLNQFVSFPKIKDLQNLIIDDLRFEIPERSFDLFEYGQQMGNCIFTYANKCSIGQCIIIGVYKEEKLTYNIEIGSVNPIDFTTAPYMSFDNPEDYRIAFEKTNRQKKNKIIQMERKFKSTMKEEEKEKISSILKRYKIIS